MWSWDGKKEGRGRGRRGRFCRTSRDLKQPRQPQNQPKRERKPLSAPMPMERYWMTFSSRMRGKNRILLCPTRLFKAILSHFFRLVDDDDDVGDDVDDDDVESSLNVKRENSGEVSVERNTCSAKTLPTSGRKLGLVSLRQPPMRDSYKRLLREVPDFFPENRKSFRETENFRKSLR